MNLLDLFIRLKARELSLRFRDIHALVGNLDLRPIFNKDDLLSARLVFRWQNLLGEQ